jgi:DNA-binding beta-propeller fold protein YncE
VADWGNSQVVHLSSAGGELWRSASGVVYAPDTVSVNPMDGSCWVADGGYNEVVHLSSAGGELWRSANSAFSARCVSANPTDGSCWVADWSQVVHLSAAGAELWRSASGALVNPSSVSVNPTGGSCWVADSGDNQVVHLSSAGGELWRSASGAFNFPYSVSANPTDGSCWVADTQHNQVVHVSAAGGDLWRSASSAFPAICVSANPTDGSCWVGWVADAGYNEVVHLSSAGEELWRSASSAFDGLWSVSANPTDGSCWVADRYNNQVVHLVVLGDIFPDVNRYYWAYQQIEAAYAAGIVQGYSDGTYQPSNPVTRDQMAVYISRALAGGDANVPSGPATATFSDVPIDYWAFKYVEYAVAENVVKGYSDGTYKPTDQVDRGQMAVFIARSIYTPTAARLDLTGYTPPATATFPDVPTDFWAYTYVEYIAQPGIDVTKGYPDGDYHPEYVCTRDQMAVYVARAFRLQ